MNKEQKPILLIGPQITPETADAFRKDGRFDVITASIGKFPSGGLFVELFRGEEKLHDGNLERLRGAKAYILQSAPESDPAAFQHLLTMAHTLKWYGVSKVTSVNPFLPNMRQDRSLKDRFTSVAADLTAKQMAASGIDAVITVTPHSKAAISHYQKVFGGDFHVVTTTEMFASDIKKRFEVSVDELSIGAPDGADKMGDEGQQRARELTKAVFGQASDDAMFRISKTHTGVSDTKITSFDGDVAGKDVVLVDDMVDGGSTIINAASLLKAHGARSVSADITHPLLTGHALEALLSAKPDGMNRAIDRLVLADTIPDVHRKLAELAASHPSLAGRVEIMSSAPALLDKITAIERDAAVPFLHRRAPGSGMAP